jgi:hypothetical protein
MSVHTQAKVHTQMSPSPLSIFQSVFFFSCLSPSHLKLSSPPLPCLPPSLTYSLSFPLSHTHAHTVQAIGMYEYILNMRTQFTAKPREPNTSIVNIASSLLHESLKKEPSHAVSIWAWICVFASAHLFMTSDANFYNTKSLSGLEQLRFYQFVARQAATELYLLHIRFVFLCSDMYVYDRGKVIL